MVVPVIDAVAPDAAVSTRLRAIGRATYLVRDGLPVQALGDVVLLLDVAAVLAQVTAVGGEGALVARPRAQPELVRATHCPALQARGITILAGGAPR